MESTSDTSNWVAATTPTSLISSHEKRFRESFCVHAPRFIVRPATLDVGNFWLDSLMAPLQLIVTQFFKNPDLDFVHNACKWSCRKKNFRPMSTVDFQVVQEPKKLMESTNTMRNQVAVAAPT